MLRGSVESPFATGATRIKTVGAHVAGGMIGGALLAVLVIAFRAMAGAIVGVDATRVFCAAVALTICIAVMCGRQRMVMRFMPHVHQQVPTHWPATMGMTRASAAWGALLGGAVLSPLIVAYVYVVMLLAAATPLAWTAGLSLLTYGVVRALTTFVGRPTVRALSRPLVARGAMSVLVIASLLALTT